MLVVRADVDPERHERFVVDLHRHPGAADGAGDGQIGALPQEAGVEQRDDLAVDRGDAQRCDAGDDVTADRPAQSDGPEHGCRRGVGDVQRRRQDLAMQPWVAFAAG